MVWWSCSRMGFVGELKTFVGGLVVLCLSELSSAWNLALLAAFPCIYGHLLECDSSQFPPFPGIVLSNPSGSRGFSLGVPLVVCRVDCIDHLLWFQFLLVQLCQESSLQK